MSYQFKLHLLEDRLLCECQFLFIELSDKHAFRRNLKPVGTIVYSSRVNLEPSFQDLHLIVEMMIMTRSSIVMLRNLTRKYLSLEMWPSVNWNGCIRSTGTLIHMIKASLGTGIMAMPLAFKNGGLIFGTFGSIIICIIYAHCVHLLVSIWYVCYFSCSSSYCYGLQVGTSQKVCKKCRVPVLGFSETVQAVLINGPPVLKPFVNFTT